VHSGECTPNYPPGGPHLHGDGSDYVMHVTPGLEALASDDLVARHPGLAVARVTCGRVFFRSSASVAALQRSFAAEKLALVAWAGPTPQMPLDLLGWRRAFRELLRERVLPRAAVLERAWRAATSGDSGTYTCGSGSPPAPLRFRCTAKRSSGVAAVTSPEIAKELGAFLHDELGWHVDLTSFALDVEVLWHHANVVLSLPLPRQRSSSEANAEAAGAASAAAAQRGNSCLPSVVPGRSGADGVGVVDGIGGSSGGGGGGVVYQEDKEGSMPRGALRLSSRPYVRHQALHPPVAWALVALAAPVTGEVVLDPVCGKGGTLLEGSRAFPRCSFLGLDRDLRQVAACAENLAHAAAFLALPSDRGGDDRGGGDRSGGGAVVGRVGLAQGNALCLPLYVGSVDVVVADVPFGKKHGLRRGLVEGVLAEAGRVLRPGTGRCVLLTPNRATVDAVLDADEQGGGGGRGGVAGGDGSCWAPVSRTEVDLGGIRAWMHLLRRTSAPAAATGAAAAAGLTHTGDESGTLEASEGGAAAGSGEQAGEQRKRSGVGNAQAEKRRRRRARAAAVRAVSERNTQCEGPESRPACCEEASGEEHHASVEINTEQVRRAADSDSATHRCVLSVYGHCHICEEQTAE